MVFRLIGMGFVDFIFYYGITITTNGIGVLEHARTNSGYIHTYTYTYIQGCGFTLEVAALSRQVGRRQVSR